GNDFDVDGDSLTIASFTQPAHGTVGQSGDGSFIFTPDPNWNGTDSFTYTVSDGAGGSASGTVSIMIASVNDAPQAFDDLLSTYEGVPATIDNVLANDIDVDGDSLSIVDFTQPSHCTVLYDWNGTFTYLPDPGYVGSDSFTYTVSDGAGGTDTGTVLITVNPGESQEVQLTIASVDASSYEYPNVPANTIDGDLRTRWSAEGDGEWIRYDLGSAKKVSKVCVAWYRGTKRISIFDIQVSADGTNWTTVYSGRNSGTTLEPEEYSFAANDDNASTTEGNAVVIDVLTNDIGTGTLSVSDHTNPAHGLAVNNGDGTFTYTPNAGWYGSDSFVYTVSNESGMTDTAIVSITVNPAESPEQLTIASVSASSYEDPNLPTNTIDSDPGTRWSAQGDGQWIEYDLGSTRTLSKVCIAWYRGDTRTSAFDIEVSADGVNWTGVYSGQSSGTTTGLEEYSFDAITARYVRIVGHCNSLNDWNSITEVAVYGF
ncbi:MAG: Ig-like domain-containing protein, partial [Planctomycetota bacterium]